MARETGLNHRIGPSCHNYLSRLKGEGEREGIAEDGERGEGGHPAEE